MSEKKDKKWEPFKSGEELKQLVTGNQLGRLGKTLDQLDEEGLKELLGEVALDDRYIHHKEMEYLRALVVRVNEKMVELKDLGYNVQIRITGLDGTMTLKISKIIDYI